MKFPYAKMKWSLQGAEAEDGYKCRHVPPEMVRPTVLAPMSVQAVLIPVLAFITEGNLDECLLQLLFGGSCVRHGGACCGQPGGTSAATCQVDNLTTLRLHFREFPTRDRPSPAVPLSPVQS